MGMSLMIFKFVDGGEAPVPPDTAVVRAVLEPHDVGDPRLTVGEDGSMSFWIRAPDGGEAEVFADVHGLGVSRPNAGDVFAVIAELTSRLGAVVLDPSRVGVVCGVEAYTHLPAEMRDDAVVIDMTGEALEAALTGPRRP